MNIASFRLTMQLPRELCGAQLIGAARVEYVEGGVLHTVLAKKQDGSYVAVYWDRNGGCFAFLAVESL